MSDKKYEIDMCQGPIVTKILKFSLPLMLSGMLQLLYNATDSIVVGQFAGKESLAAVGSTGSLINLIIGLFVGLSVGASVAISKYYGARDYMAVSRCVHTCILMAIVAGIALAAVGIILSPVFLAAMGTPADVIDKSTLYMRIFMSGLPANLLYNFGSAVLRSVGDTKRPMYFLMVSGIVNVGLNLFFVIVCKMDVAGVGVATIVAQILSAAAVITCLLRSTGCYRLYPSKLRFHKSEVLEILKVGLPAGIQGTVFSLSNVLIQASVNVFGSAVMAGNTAASNIGDFTYQAMNSIHHAALTGVAQNRGAKNYKRMVKIMLHCFWLVTAIGVFFTILTLSLRNVLLGIYTSDPAVIAVGATRLVYVGLLYFTCGLMDTLVGAVRGLGSALLPMVASILGVCGVRIVWILTIFPQHHTLEMLYVSYPVSWIFTCIVHSICLIFFLKKTKERMSLL